MSLALDVKLAAAGALGASAAWVHFRGRVRHGFLRQLTDHSTFLAPVNALVYAFSAVPSRPFLDPAAFPDLEPLRLHWEEIRDEALRLRAQDRIGASARHDDVGFHSLFRQGWRRFYLTWYGAPIPTAAAACPRTVALLRGIPAVRAALFALLPAGGRLPEHRDPFAGSLRYHLGLATPNDAACRIVVDGEAHAWRDGEAIVFDETYVHHAANGTEQDRLILFCDVERPLRGRLPRRVNRWLGDHVMRATRGANDASEPVGAVSAAFDRIYRVRLVGKRLKAWNRTVYYLVKYALLAGVVWAVFA